MKNDSHADAEIVLCAVEHSGRVVVKLYRPDGNAIARANVETTSKRAGKPRFAVREIRRTWTREHRDANVIIKIDAIANMRSANESMSEWLEGPFGGVVF